MKKLILLLSVFLFAFSIYAQEPIIKIDIGNGNYKTYNLSEIQNISLTNYNNDASLWIYYQKTKTISQEISGIDSIKFESSQTNFTNLVLYIAGSTPKSCVLSEIDSIKIQEKLLDKFETVTIGTQVWMLKNLDVDHYRNGDSIPEERDGTKWSNLTTGAWCHYINITSYGLIYGKLYNWYAVNDPRGLAPAGWHIASVDEWQLLSDFLGGYSISGGKLKESGTNNWISPNYASNSSGFTALPGGHLYINYAYEYLGTLGFWWTSSYNNVLNSKYIYLKNSEVTLFVGNIDKHCGLSVRCIKD